MDVRLNLSGAFQEESLKDSVQLEKRQTGINGCHTWLRAKVKCLKQAIDTTCIYKGETLPTLEYRPDAPHEATKTGPNRKDLVPGQKATLRLDLYLWRRVHHVPPCVHAKNSV